MSIFSLGLLLTVISTSNALPTFMPRYDSQLKTGTIRSTDNLCDVCVQVFTAIKTALGNQYNQGQIENAIKQSVCPELGSVQYVCNQFVDQYLRAIMTKVSADLQPRQDCVLFSFCIGVAEKPPMSGHPVLALQRLLRTPKGSLLPFTAVSCSKCRALILGSRWRQLRGVTSNWQSEAVRLMGSAVCDSLAAEQRFRCLQDFQHQYTGILWLLIRSQLDSVTVCKTLGVCEVAEVVTLKSSNKPKAAIAVLTTPPDNACIICETVVQYTKLLLKDNATEQQIVLLMEKVCQFVPGEPQVVCRSMVEQLGSLVFQMLEKDVGPLLICQTLQFCPAQSQTSPLSQHPNLRQQPTDTRTLRFAKLTPSRTIVEFIVKEATAQKIPETV